MFSADKILPAKETINTNTKPVCFALCIHPTIIIYGFIDAIEHWAVLPHGVTFKLAVHYSWIITKHRRNADKTWMVYGVLCVILVNLFFTAEFCYHFDNVGQFLDERKGIFVEKYCKIIFVNVTNNEQCIDGCSLFVDWLCRITIVGRKICFIIYLRIVYRELYYQ